MIWELVGPSHWVVKEFKGYEVHTRARSRKNAKTAFDNVRESWVIEIESGKTAIKFRDQPHVDVALHKSIAFVKLLIAEKIYRETILGRETDKIRQRKSRMIQEYCRKNGITYEDLPLST